MLHEIFFFWNKEFHVYELKNFTADFLGHYLKQRSPLDTRAADTRTQIVHLFHEFIIKNEGGLSRNNNWSLAGFSVTVVVKGKKTHRHSR